jgi:hypothetical protein
MSVNNDDSDAIYRAHIAAIRKRQATCQHENADHLQPGEHLSAWDDLVEFGITPEPALIEQFRCLDCGAWLSLGLANDDDERVREELEAVNLAPSMTDPWFIVANAEVACFHKGDHSLCDVCPLLYLAAFIATGVEEQP